MDQIADIVLAVAVQVCDPVVCVFAKRHDGRWLLTASFPLLPLSPDKEASDPLQTPVVLVKGRKSDVSESSQADPKIYFGGG